MIARMLDHPKIVVAYGLAADAALASQFLRAIYTGPIDSWFNHCFGRLGYRTDFELIRANGTMQDVAQVNYCDLSMPWTRITEHKHFTPWESHARTVLSRETSRNCEPEDTPYYPLRLAGDQPLVDCYFAAARETNGISFVGRLATYRYLDMDVAIAEALRAARMISTGLRGGSKPSALFVPTEASA